MHSYKGHSTWCLSSGGYKLTSRRVLCICKPSIYCWCKQSATRWRPGSFTVEPVYCRHPLDREVPAYPGNNNNVGIHTSVLISGVSWFHCLLHVHAWRESQCSSFYNEDVHGEGGIYFNILIVEEQDIKDTRMSTGWIGSQAPYHPPPPTHPLLTPLVQEYFLMHAVSYKCRRNILLWHCVLRSFNVKSMKDLYKMEVTKLYYARRRKVTGVIEFQGHMAFGLVALHNMYHVCMW